MGGRGLGTMAVPVLEHIDQMSLDSKVESLGINAGRRPVRMAVEVMVLACRRGEEIVGSGTMVSPVQMFCRRGVVSDGSWINLVGFPRPLYPNPSANWSQSASIEVFLRRPITAGQGNCRLCVLGLIWQP